jgi:hypothetical protein
MRTPETVHANISQQNINNMATMRKFYLPISLVMMTTETLELRTRNFAWRHVMNIYTYCVWEIVVILITSWWWWQRLGKDWQ